MCTSSPKAPPPPPPPPQAPMTLEQEAPTQSTRRSQTKSKRDGVSKYKISKKGAVSASIGGIPSNK